MKTRFSLIWAALAVLAHASPALAQTGHRARDLGIPFQGVPGPFNAITDVPGVEVGQRTLISGSGQLVEGRGPVRTGVTIIHPLGRNGREAVVAGRAVINGVGEVTGVSMVDELGLLFGPIALTGTGNLSVVHQALVDWSTRPNFLPPDERFTRLLPVVGETLDLALNDVFGHPMRAADVYAALDGARGGPVEEGNVGGGTGMVAYYFKGGIGTSSRIVTAGNASYTVGVLVQTNNGDRRDLRIAGVPIGEEITDLMPRLAGMPIPDGAAGGKNSLLVVIATDAPLQAHQLNRLARRAVLGIGRNGSTVSNFSGEFVIAFTVANPQSLTNHQTQISIVSDSDETTLNGLFAATVQAVEEAIVNQLVAAETMEGINGNTVYALPRERLVRLLRAHNRWIDPHSRAQSNAVGSHAASPSGRGVASAGGPVPPNNDQARHGND